MLDKKLLNPKIEYIYFNLKLKKYFKTKSSAILHLTIIQKIFTRYKLSLKFVYLNLEAYPNDFGFDDLDNEVIENLCLAFSKLPCLRGLGININK